VLPNDLQNRLEVDLLSRGTPGLAASRQGGVA